MTTLVLLHGLGATSGVWSDVIDRLDWHGPIIAPDLPGHGAAPWTGDYTVGALAASVSSHVANASDVVVVGHSLGGGVATCLASNVFRPVVRSVLAIGVKVVWTDDDVAAMAKVAGRDPRMFDTRDEAVRQFLKFSGLVGVADADHRATTNAVTEVDGQWRVAQDPATFAQRKLDMAGLLAAAKCPVVLAAGGTDAMVSAADLEVHRDAAASIEIADDRGHNVQIEDPDWVVSQITRLTS